MLQERDAIPYLISPHLPSSPLSHSPSLPGIFKGRDYNYLPLLPPPPSPPSSLSFSYLFHRLPLLVTAAAFVGILCKWCHYNYYLVGHRCLVVGLVVVVVVVVGVICPAVNSKRLMLIIIMMS